MENQGNCNCTELAGIIQSWLLELVDVIDNAIAHEGAMDGFMRNNLLQQSHELEQAIMSGVRVDA